MVKTFESIFCERHRCDKWEFRKSVFRATLYRHAIPVASLVRAQQRRIFAPDFLLIEYVSRATDLRAVADEVKEFGDVAENRRWLRRVGRVRISGARILRFASEYLPGKGATAKSRG